MPRHVEPYVTGVYFFNENAGQLRHDPEADAGWYMFDPGARVYLLVIFQDGTEDTVNAAFLFLTPTETETLEYREQIAIQAAGEGRDFALFAWDIPEELTAHLEIVLECGGGARVTETLNVATEPVRLGEERNTNLTEPHFERGDNSIQYEPRNTEFS